MMPVESITNESEFPECVVDEMLDDDAGPSNEEDD